MKDKKIFGYIMKEINRLTNDEDLRQELWIFFLEGNSPFYFKEHLIIMQEKEDNILNYMESMNGLKEKL